MLELFLVTQQSTFSTEVVVWIVGSILLVASIILLIWQRKAGRELSMELSHLEKMKKHNVEYELVLKAMRLCTWHIDVAARTITYDNDFRERNDCFMPEPGTSLDVLVEAMADADKKRIQKSLEEICEGDKDKYHEISQIRSSQDGSYYWTESYATVTTRDTEGKPLVIVGTSMCIDERKEMESALVIARNKAEESDRLKSAFIANMSHEIRTPLNAIIGFTSVLPDIDGDEERKELIGLIQENNQKLLRIIDDVMNISKIESGKEKLVMTSFELNDFIRSLMDGHVPNLQPGVSLSAMFNQSALNVTTDMDRLREILNHLLSNAVKFTSKGSIIIGYDAPHEGRVRLWVQDTGKGISPEHQERVFERFFKVDEYIPGAGLGLSICRTMAYSIGGDVGVESTLGEGSKFWVDLPIK
jgi:Signal transduction histidine kinase